jgi:hypothetical protein
LLLIEIDKLVIFGVDEALGKELLSVEGVE